MMENVSAFTERHRIAIGLAICLGSALFGTVALFEGSHPTEVAFWVWIVWAQTVEWLERRHWLFSEAGRRMLHKTPGHIYQEAKLGRLRAPAVIASPVTRVIGWGARLMLAVTVVCFFES